MDASVRDAFPNENTPLGPFLGNLPVDVLRVVLGLLTPFERALFARAGGACYRVAKQSGLGRAGVSSRDIKQLMHMDELTASMSVFTWSLSNLGDPDKTVTRVIVFGTHPRHAYLWDESLGTLVAKSAAGADTLDFLVRLRDASTGEDAMPYPWKNSRTCSEAARKGRQESIKWLRANGCPWNETTCDGAALGGHLDVLKWLRANGCPWDWRTSLTAATQGTLDTLKWAHANGCPWDELTCSGAASGGHLDVLKWARANGCPWDETTCALAASGGHLDVLKWLRANGCPWDETTCALAAGGGHLDVLRWARENGFSEVDAQVWRTARAAKAKQLKGMMYVLRDDGFPWDSHDDDG